MDFKERFLTAVNHEEPDRVPVMGLIMDPTTCNQILGKKPVDFVGMLRKPLMGRQIKTLLNSNRFWNGMYYGNFSDALESAARLGFDANWTIYALMKLFRNSQTSLGWSFHDPFGRVWEPGSDETGNLMLNYSRALCETEEQWEA